MLRRLFISVFGKSKSRTSKIKRPRFGSEFEQLGDRVVPAIAMYSVNTTADTADVLGDNKPEDAFGKVSLRSIIDFSQQMGNAINGAFAQNHYAVDFNGIANQTIVLTAPLFELQSNFNILGNNVTIECQDGAQFRHFKIKEGTVSHLLQLTLKNGFVGGDGGSILNNGDLRVVGCDFVNNRANGLGGAIASGDSTTLLVSYSYFWHNTAWRGGAVGTVDIKELKLSGCEIFANESLSVLGTLGDGGGVYVKGYSGDAELNGLPTIDQQTHIFGNSAGGKGGGLYVEGTSFVMSGGYLHGNQATGDGGGLYANVIDRTVTLTNVAVTSNQSAGKGGGAYIRNGKLEGTITALTGNTATGGINGVGYKKDDATAPVTIPANQQTKEEDP